MPFDKYGLQLFPLPRHCSAIKLGCFITSAEEEKGRSVFIMNGIVFDDVDCTCTLEYFTEFRSRDEALHVLF